MAVFATDWTTIIPVAKQIRDALAASAVSQAILRISACVIIDKQTVDLLLNTPVLRSIAEL